MAQNKLLRSFITEWHKRYSERIEKNMVVSGILRDANGCMCAMGVAYDMLVEGGHGEWVGTFGKRYTCPELYGMDTGNQTGISVLMGCLDVNGPVAMRLARIVRLNDLERYEEAAVVIKELEQYVDADSVV